MDQNENILNVLIEINDTLKKIFLCYEEKYKEIYEEKEKERKKTFLGMLTDSRKIIFPLLFDKKNLSQRDIAKKSGVSHQAVSQFINSLIENDIIEQFEKDGNKFYLDKHNYLKLVK